MLVWEPMSSEIRFPGSMGAVDGMFWRLERERTLRSTMVAVAILEASDLDGAWLCRVKPDLASGGLLARFSHAAQAELLGAVEDGAGGPALRLGGRSVPLPEL